MKDIKSKKINIALIGCGRISQKHILAIISENKRCDLVAICDNNEKQIEKISDFYDSKLKESNLPLKHLIKFNDYDELINAKLNNKIDIDLIVLATPSGLHPMQTKIAANSGINVCTEKPMALNLADAQEMVKVCKEANVKLFVIKQNRLNPTLQILKKKVEENKFGNIGIVDINVFWQRPQSYYDQDEWRGTKALDGGALLNQASHYVDLIEWIIGPLYGLYANISTISRNIEVEDTAVMQLKWKNGALGSMSVTMITYPKNIEGSITIIGDKGSAKVGGIAVNEFEYSFFEDDINSSLKKYNYKTESVYGFGHNFYYQNMIDNLLSNAKPICDGENGLSSIKIINAAYKSAKEQKFIKISCD
jgi:UDP-N-acetyl-2-amino-2-deoxyglucuronate dehydrogenase